MNRWNAVANVRKSSKVKSILASVCILSSVLTVASSGISSAASNSPAPPLTVTSIPGVSVDASGTFHYASTLTSPLDLSGAVTTVVQGARDASGNCVMSGSHSSSTNYTEETAYNPTTCQDTVVSGQLTSAGAAALAVRSPTTVAPTATASPLGAPVAQVSPLLSGYFTAYNKIEFIDPIDLTIVSLSNNFTWQISGTSVPWASINPYAYMEHMGGDVTTNLGGGTSFVSFGSTSIEGLTHNSWTNSDFEAWVVAVLGIVGYAACGFDSSPAQFYLNPDVRGFNNATYGVAWASSRSGGCVNLTHFGQENGPGSLN